MDLDDIDNAPTDQKVKMEKYKEYLEQAVKAGSEQQIKDLVVHGNDVNLLMVELSFCCKVCGLFYEVQCMGGCIEGHDWF